MGRLIPLLGLVALCVACTTVGLNPAQQKAQERFDDCKQATGASSAGIVFIRDDGTGFRYTGNNLDQGRIRDCMRTKYNYRFPGDPGYRGVLR
jgi:hypothetical protein